MSMIRFSAEASLYKASGHYRTGRQALYLPRRTNSMRLALDEGEVIVIKDCPPGWKKLGEGVCVPETLVARRWRSPLARLRSRLVRGHTGRGVAGRVTCLARSTGRRRGPKKPAKLGVSSARKSKRIR